MTIGTNISYAYNAAPAMATQNMPTKPVVGIDINTSHIIPVHKLLGTYR